MRRYATKWYEQTEVSSGCRRIYICKTLVLTSNVKEDSNRLHGGGAHVVAVVKYNLAGIGAKGKSIISKCIQVHTCRTGGAHSVRTQYYIGNAMSRHGILNEMVGYDRTKALASALASGITGQ